MNKNLTLLAMIFIFAMLTISQIFINQESRAKADAELTCSKDDDCPTGRCSNGKEFLQYSCLNGTCNQILYFVDPCLDLSSSSGSSSLDCKCNSGEHFDGTNCIADISGTTLACTLEYNPVCGCDGSTYGNACSANASGIKKYTQGECLSNNSSGLSSTDKNFSGIWRGKISICPIIDPPPNPSPEINCIVCPQVIPLCAKGFTLSPQSCLSCATCIKCSGKSNAVLKLCAKDSSITGSVNIDNFITNGTITSTEIISEKTVKLTIQDTSNNASTLNLTLDKNRTLSGDLEGIGQNSILLKKFKQNISCKDNCKNPCGDKCCKRNEECLALESFPVQYKCSSIMSMSSSSGICAIPDCAAPPPGCNYVPEETSSGCPRSCGTLICSSSGDISDCSSRGSCRGENGEALQCPIGTECSGLPAYGCYPPGCPVPICCSEDTNILTPKGQVKISKLKKGDYVISDNGEPAYILQTTKVRVHNHKVKEIKLDDGTVLEISPGHPTGPDSMRIGGLKPGYKLDGRVVISAKEIPYKGKYTYDILPSSLTGNYYANGVKIGSTLFMSTLIKHYKNW